MLREILEKLSGGQISAIAIAAILAPGAAVATITYQAVAIVDPVTGKQSFVDASRRLSVFDPVAGYRNLPGNIVEIATINHGSQCETLSQYAVPSGKALVITAISGDESQYDGAINVAGFTVYNGANCTGNVLTSHFSSVSTANSVAPVNGDFGVGIAVKAGKTISINSVNNIGYTFLHGYLVPAAAVPAALAPADAASEPRPITAAQVAANMKKLPLR